MATRKPSTTSLSLRQRKYSTDRHLRRADLAARLEEEGPKSASLDIKNGDTIHEEDLLAQLQRYGMSSARTDIVPVVREIHPGKRLSSIPMSAQLATTSTQLNDVKPWAEPDSRYRDDIERRAAVLSRHETQFIDIQHAQNQLARPVTSMNSKVDIIRRIRDFFSKKEQPTISRGLALPASMSAQLGLALTQNRSAHWLKRQHLHVFDYSIGEDQVFSCNSNRSFSTTAELRQHLGDLDPASDLRVIHVRNSVEALNYLDHAFAISASEHNEKGFLEWMHQERDRRRTSNMTVRWRPCFDVQRSIITTSFGIAFGTDDISLLADLNYNQLCQRRQIACYMQRSVNAAAPGPKVMRSNVRVPGLAEFASQPTLILCEFSADATCELTNTASLLALNRVANGAFSGPSAIVASAIRHVFEEIVGQWDRQIVAIHQEFTDLEDLVYAQPANASYEKQLWDWSQRLHTMLKLISRHLKAIQDFQEDLQHFSEIDETTEWLDDILEELQHLGDAIKIDYIESLEHMIDLMYKSVTIRDSRRSLELNASLWRLSWITFIFLPLTFLVGFFGMNVDTFEHYPSIKWYFAGLIPLAGGVFVFWLIFRILGTKEANHEAHGKVLSKSRLSARGTV